MPDAFLASAPGRAGIIGNPTDMYGGSVISCSTQERAVVLVEPSDTMRFEVAGQVLDERGTNRYLTPWARHGPVE